MINGPRETARAKHEEQFSSKLFEPETKNIGFGTNGRQMNAVSSFSRRRDMTTAELFGEHSNESAYNNIRANREDLPPFVPKDDPRSSQKKKMDFLGSSVLSSHAGGELLVVDGEHQSVEAFEHNNSQKCSPEARPFLRKQQDHISDVNTGHDAVHSDISPRKDKNLVVSDMNWQTTPQAPGILPDAAVTHRDRGAASRASDLFERNTPATVPKSSEAVADEKVFAKENGNRKHHQTYSNLFGRELGGKPDAAGREYRRMKPQQEDVGPPNQVWTSSKKEYAGDAGLSARGRVNREFFNSTSSEDSKAQSSLGASTELWDNSDKIQRGGDIDHKEISKRHLRSTYMGQEDIESVVDRQELEWSNADLFVSGLNPHHDNYDLKKIVHRAAPGFQLVKSTVDCDPVSGVSKRTGHVCVRFSHLQMLDDLILGLQKQDLDVDICPFGA